MNEWFSFLNYSLCTSTHNLRLDHYGLESELEIFPWWCCLFYCVYLYVCVCLRESVMERQTEIHVEEGREMSLFFTYLFFKYLFIWLLWVLAVACGICFLD